MSLEEGKISGPVKSNSHALVLDQLGNRILSRKELVSERPQIKRVQNSKTNGSKTIKTDHFIDRLLSLESGGMKIERLVIIKPYVLRSADAARSIYLC